MIHLSILGDVDLSSAEGHPVSSVLSQPKRFALLVYLALESDGRRIQRDELLGVFWPDLPQENAKQSLRTALYFLRRSLGRQTIVAEAGEVAIRTGLVACDAVNFGAALEKGDFAEALRLYRGDLLPGFFLDDGPAEFERWLEEARAEMRRRAAEAAWLLAQAEERTGSTVAAGAWARKAADLSGGDEAAVRRLIELLERIGDSAGAVETYEDLARRLRQNFDLAPSAETESLMDRIRAERLATGTWEAISPNPAGPQVTQAAPLGASRSEPAHLDGGGCLLACRYRRRAACLSGTLLLVAGLYSLWSLAREDPRKLSGRPTPVVQVAGIQDHSPNPDGADLAGALTTELVAQLGETAGLRVIHTGSSGSLNAAPSSVPTYFVRGGLLRSDSIARVTAVLIDGESGATIKRVSVDRPLNGAPFWVEEMAEMLSELVRRHIGRRMDENRWRTSIPNQKALWLVRLAARDVAAADSLSRAGAAEAADFRYERADSQLALAQTIAPQWSAPSVQRAEAAFRRMWSSMLPPVQDPSRMAAALHAGKAHADSALAIEADEPAALELRGTIGYWLWLTSPPHAETGTMEFLAQVEQDLVRATELDPTRPRPWTLLSASLQARGEFAAAHWAAARAFQHDAYLEHAPEILARLFTTSIEIGDMAAAARWCAKIQSRIPGSWFSEYCKLEQIAWGALNSEGVTDSAWMIVNAATSRSPVGKQLRPRFEMVAAVILARAGLRDSAQSVIRSARQTAGADPELLKLEAWARLALGEKRSALKLLERLIAADPRSARPVLQSRRFREVQNDLHLQQILPAMRYSR